MPELPEVEIVVRGLKKVILNRTIASVAIKTPKINSDNYAGWKKDLEGKTVLDIRRRGKNILIELSDRYILWVHLKMTGRFYFLPEDSPSDKHDLVVFHFKHNGRILRFNDYRRFGRIRLIRADSLGTQKGLAELGPEPLEITAEDFIRRVRSARRMIKPALLDQTFIAGLGNIYADEALYAAGIHPRRSTDRISPRKLRLLHGHIQRLLKKSIRLMGTTVDSFAGINGQTGRFQSYLLAYGREGQPCGICGTGIRREKIGSRSAHYCPRCQRR